MINDFFADNTSAKRQNDIKNIVKETKTYYHEDRPYKIYPSAYGEDNNVIIFSDHFITTMRLVMSEPAEGCIVQFSKYEREVYYAFMKYQDGIDPDDAEMLLVVEELDNCIVNELICKTPTYIDRCFNLRHDWEDCQPREVPILPKTIELLKSEYDNMVERETIDGHTLYIVSNDPTPDVVSYIYMGLIVLWEGD
jgi:hypothetical protein